jgi:hypothetical protein
MSGDTAGAASSCAVEGIRWAGVATPKPCEADEHAQGGHQCRYTHGRDALGPFSRTSGGEWVQEKETGPLSPYVDVECGEYLVSPADGVATPPARPSAPLTP